MSRYHLIKQTLCTVFMMFGLTTASLADDTVIKAGHVIDPVTGKVIDNQYITVTRNKITAISSKMPKDHQGTVVDLSNQWLMPGLMDMHTHLTANTNRGEYLIEATLKRDTAYRALTGAKMAKDVLYAGFTTVRDVGNAGEYVDAALGRAIREGLIEGPRIIGAGKIISVFGGQSSDIAQEHGAFWGQEYVDVVSPDDMRRAIHKNIYYGARVIKLVVGDQLYSLSPETIKAAVDEAKSAGMNVAAHTWEDAHAARASNAGVASIEHGFNLSDDTLKLMKENGTYLAGTEFPWQYLDMVWDNEARSKDFNKKNISQLARAYKIGTPLVFSTDIVNTYNGETRGEMSINYLQGWIDAKIPPRDILKAMTINGAKLINMEKLIGSIDVNKIADIIATPTNPLDDIWALKEVCMVMQGGSVIKNTCAK